MKKIVIIGGGPGGYVAAIRAAQLGAQVTLVEKNKIGGTCLNVGCIPTKSLLHSAEVLVQVKTAQKAGITAELTGFDWNAIMERKNTVVQQLVKGVQGLMKVNGIEVIAGVANFINDTTIQVTKKDDSEVVLTPDKIIIATGSQPFIPPIAGLESVAYLDSSKALALEKLPQSMAIIGGGVIGLEFASIFQAFGVAVTVIEEQSEILPAMDQELASLLRKKLKRNGIKFLTNTRVEGVAANSDGVELKLTDKTLTAEKLLVAVGRRSYLAGLGIENTSLKIDKGAILVDETTATNLKNIFAIGDCTGEVMLAHYASAQGEVAAENALGANKKMQMVTPGCIYSDPEFAGVGLTEQAAKAQSLNYSVGKFPLKASGKALVMDKTYGVAKVLLDENKKILGVHLLCERATDLIAEAALVMQQGGSAEMIIEAIHPHPTLSEVVREATLAAENKALHISN